MIFFASSRKMTFVFLKNMIFLSRKMKDTPSMVLKTIDNFFIFSKISWKYDVFCIFNKDGISFSYKLWNYSSVKQSKYDLLPKYTPKDDISSITEKNDTRPRKYDIDILGWHPRMGSNDLLYFYGDLFRCFPILLSDEKTRRYNMQDWRLTLSVSDMVGNSLQWRVFNTLYHWTLRSCI